MGWNMAGLSQRFERGRGPDGPFALVLRVDGLAQLARVLGMEGLVALLDRIAGRAAAGLRLAQPPSADAGGHLCLMLSDRDAGAALRRALRVQALCGGKLDLEGQQVRPGISAVLVRAGSAAVSATALFDAGRRHLAGRPAGDRTRIALIDWSPALARGLRPRQALAPIAASPHAGVEGVTFDPDWVEAHFQPQLCCHTGAVTGFELLARLRDPQRGLLRPAEFLPGLSPDQSQALTRAMLMQGLAALRHWDRTGHEVAAVSLNVAGSDLAAAQFADSLLWELDRQDIAPARLVIEVMEELSPLDAPRRVNENLRRLRAAGCRIDLDDFGTGHASLDAIRRLGVHRVKIDRSFVTGCDRDADQQRTILAVLALAGHLGLDTLAEGVETPGEHAFAAQIGCSHVQGYAVAAPMRLAETDAFLAQRRVQAAELPRLRRRA